MQRECLNWESLAELEFLLLNCGKLRGLKIEDAFAVGIRDLAQYI